MVFASPILKSAIQGRFRHSEGNLAIQNSDDVQETSKTVCLDAAMIRKISMSQSVTVKASNFTLCCSMIYLKKPYFDLPIPLFGL